MWVAETSAALSAASSNYDKSFLAQFGHAIPMRDLPSDVEPNAILFDIANLRETVVESPDECQILLSRAGKSRVLSESQALGFLSILDQVLPITEDVIGAADNRFRARVVGQLRRSGSGISVRGGYLERAHIRTPTEEVRLSTYLNRESRYVITFTNPEYAFSGKQLFRDSRLLTSIDRLLKSIETSRALIGLTDEKAVESDNFGSSGVFRQVEDVLFSDAIALVCDDLGDEWADYIAIERGERYGMAFVHCKHADLSTSASALQVPVGQALKNLSRMHREFSVFETKFDNKWESYYEATTISRIRNGQDPGECRKVFRAAISDPNLDRRALLVLSGVSLAEIAKVFGELRAGTSRAHVVQLLWLLEAFVSGCREHGVRPQIVCQP